MKGVFAFWQRLLAKFSVYRLASYSLSTQWAHGGIHAYISYVDMESTSEAVMMAPSVQYA